MTLAKEKCNEKGEEDDEGCTGKLKMLKRHLMTMCRVTNNRFLKKRLKVLFDKNETLVGENANEMQSYIGVLARLKNPISIAS